MPLHQHGEITMRHSSPQCRLAYLAMLASVLFACTPPPQRYSNAVHPQYGDAEFLADLAQCRDQSATAMVTTSDYMTHSYVRVNETRANGCMTRHGWEPVSTADSWSPPLYTWSVW